MVVVKYIGRTTDFKGKNLWEIVGNLKNLGVGRTVVRSKFERYPEKTFFKILSVTPEPAGDVYDTRRVDARVEKTFRGKKFPNPVSLLSSSYKADFRLLSKEEEIEYCNVTKQKEFKVVPSSMEMPPIMKKVLLREYSKKGINVDVNNMTLPLRRPGERNKLYVRFAAPEEGLKPHPYALDITKTHSPSLYAGLTFPDQPNNQSSEK